MSAISQGPIRRQKVHRSFQQAESNMQNCSLGTKELKKQRENTEVSQVTTAEDARASLGLEEQREKVAIVKMKFGGWRAMELKPRPLGRRCQLVALVSLGGKSMRLVLQVLGKKLESTVILE